MGVVMPEAALHEDRPFALAIGEVRRPREQADMAAIGESQPPQQRRDDLLGGGAALPHPRHQRRAPGIGLQRLHSAATTGISARRIRSRRSPSRSGRTAAYLATSTARAGSRISRNIVMSWPAIAIPSSNPPIPANDPATFMPNAFASRGRLSPSEP